MPSTVDPDVLVLPHAAIATLSPAPYLTAHLVAQQSRRPNGRNLDDFRPIACHSRSLTHCVGSAVVRAGDMAVVCGIQAEILLLRDVPNPPQPAEENDARSGYVAQLNLVAPNIDLANGCSPQHLPGAGGPPRQDVQTLGARLLSLLLSSKLVDVESLKITRKAALDDDDEPMDGESSSKQELVGFWTLYPSIHVMSLSGETSLFDVAWGALVAALKDVRLPRAYWSPDLDCILCSDVMSEVTQLTLRGWPVAASWSLFKALEQDVLSAAAQNSTDARATGKTLDDGSQAWLIADPDGFEDELCDEHITLVIDCTETGPAGDARILSVEKSGGSSLGIKDVHSLLPPATQRWKEWTSAVS